jgi:glucokinase
VSEGASAVCDRIAGEIRSLLGETSHVAGVGIGSPGIIDSDTGIVRDAVNLQWRQVPLAREISARLDGIDVTIANDADANAIGEGMFGSAVSCRNYVLLTIGSGLGCGVVSGGTLVGGRDGIAADLGHFSLDPDRGIRCRCGNIGCAETIVSGPGLVALAGGASTANDIVTAARAGDPVAASAINALAIALGHIAAVAAAVVNPELVIIGGGLGVAAFDLFEETAEREMRRRLPPSYRGVELRVATLASPAIGAASLVFARGSTTRELA